MSEQQKKRRWLAGFSSITILLIGAILGGFFWGSFNWGMDLTNTEQFCISCHEMKDNVYEEYRNTVHHNNRTGVRATCADCHVPKEWGAKVIRKIQASNDLYHTFLGTIDTKEKFEAKRLELARRVWKTMKATDSRECRNCHDFESMDYTKQQRRAINQHVKGFDNGETCIDCHKGIAHSLPDMHEVDPSAVVGQ